MSGAFESLEFSIREGQGAWLRINCMVEGSQDLRLGAFGVVRVIFGLEVGYLGICHVLLQATSVLAVALPAHHRRGKS